MPSTLGIVSSHYTRPPAPVSLLLNGNGTNNANNNTFLDSSSTPKTITRVGSVTQGSFSPFPLNGAAYNPSVHGGSGYFDGDGTTQVLRAPINAFNFGTDDFTVEFWINPTRQASYNAGRDFVIFGQETPGSGVLWSVVVSSYSGYRGLSFAYGVWGSYTVGLHTNNWLTANQWQHVAVTREGTTWRIFVNGVSQTLSIYNEGRGSWNSAFNFNNTTVATSRVGGWASNNPYYLSNVRFINGTALYTGSSLTVPTAPLTNVTNTSLLLDFTNGGVIDSVAKNNLVTFGNAQISTAQSKFGGSSIYFDGTGDYLTIPASDGFNFGTGDFTVELWYYPLASNQYPVALELGNHTLARGCGFFLQDNSALTPMIYSGAFYRPASIPSIVMNQWNHVVWQRTSGNLRIFVNGVGSNTTAFSNAITLPSQISIGYSLGYSGSNAGYYCNGYIDDLRITRGAIYTNDFTPPTSELPTTDPIDLNSL